MSKNRIYFSFSVVSRNFCSRYITYYVRLEEGIPPKHFDQYRAPKTSKQMLEEYVKDHRSKNIRKW